MLTFPTFQHAVDAVQADFLQEARPIRSKFWQATDVSARPEAQMYEQQFVSFGVQVPNLQYSLEDSIAPNLPWAEDHFIERISRRPVNPGKTWVDWPWSNAADKHRTDGEKFSHNYMERYWPRYAGEPMEKYWPEGVDLKGLDIGHSQHRGIRFPYGDLDDVIRLIAKDPTTRQAYLPVFFPEDTGAVHGERIPCSIGYHFMMRDGRMNCVYQLRSCDLWRHFRDDLYLTARLLQWVIEELAIEHSLMLRPGRLIVHISSLHLFINDYHALTKAVSGRRA